MTDIPPANLAAAADVIAFWFAAGPKKWFSKDAGFDAAIREKFLPTYEAAARGQLAGWETTAQGALALIIVLDQLPRNMFRGLPRAFATDALARAAAARAMAHGFDRQFAVPKRNFFYLPLMHSENLADQERCVGLFRTLGDAEALKYADLHADIVRRFGRFPHRNAILGRATTAAERAFLDSGGFAG
jgi:uncharacterized protein (DUF924 family)